MSFFKPPSTLPTRYISPIFFFYFLYLIDIVSFFFSFSFFIFPYTFSTRDSWEDVTKTSDYRRLRRAVEEDRQEAREAEMEDREDDNEEANVEENIDWDCSEDKPKEREFLESILPEEFKYRVNKLRIEEESEIVAETKFRTEFVVDVCSKKETDEFIKFIEEKSGNCFRPRRKEEIKTNFSSNRYNCIRKVRDQRRKEEVEEPGKKRCGSGRHKGEERQVGKGTDCEAHFSYKLYKCHQNHKEGEQKCFNLSIRLNNNHNHEVASTKSWNFLNVTREVKERYNQLFSEHMAPVHARQAYIAELKQKLGEDGFFKISAKRSINPDANVVFNMYTKYCKRFGSANGPDSFMRAVEVRKIQIPHVLHTCTSSTLASPPHLHLLHQVIGRTNEKAGEEIASIRQLSCGTVVVAVVKAFFFSNIGKVRD